MKQIIAKFIADEQGQDIIEYALVGSFVSLASYAGASALGTAVRPVVQGHQDRGRQGLGQGSGGPVNPIGLVTPVTRPASLHVDRRGMTMKQIIAKFIADEQGQDIIEYALVGSFVSLASYAGASALGTAYDQWFRTWARRGQGLGQGSGGPVDTPRLVTRVTGLLSTQR
jgi:Flp pilus assembly pilin Flp